MALCPGLPGWASTRKVKPIWILLMLETVSGSGISWAVCKSASLSRQITTCYIPRWYTRPKTVTHPGTNRARRALTSFIRRTPLTTTPRRQPSASVLQRKDISCEMTSILALSMCTTTSSGSSWAAERCRAASLSRRRSRHSSRMISSGACSDNDKSLYSTRSRRPHRRRPLRSTFLQILPTAAFPFSPPGFTIWISQTVYCYF